MLTSSGKLGARKQNEVKLGTNQTLVAEKDDGKLSEIIELKKASRKYLAGMGETMLTAASIKSS